MRISPQGTVPSLQSQRGYLLITVVVMLFLVASIAMLLNYDSSISANTSTGELETARAEYVAQAGMQHALWRTQNNACMGNVSIPATTLGKDNYTASITGAAAGTAYTLTADQDAWIRSDDVTKNNGTTADQHLRFETGKVEQALTRFDLSSLPANAQINSATAWFYITPTGPGGGAHPEGPVTVHRVTADWTETDATWDTMNGNFENSTLATIPAQPDDSIWVSFNLTGQVQAWANGQPNYGVLMRSIAEGVHGKYSSREDGGNAPRLEVVVGSGAASPVSIQATGTLADGNTRSLTRLASPAMQPSGTYTFQPDATDGIDAYIWEAQKSTNKGTDDETWISRTSNNASLSLLKFNMGAIPARSKILSATLSLHNRSGNNSNVPVTAHRITNPWNEDFVTWNNRDSGTTWDTAGGDVDPTAIASTNVGPTRYIRYEWDITGLVQGWTDGAYANYGVALATAMASSVGERFDTSDHSDPTRRPMLTIEYACECGSACMAPQGSGNILMVVDEKTALNPGEQTTKSYFEAWGYTVNLISDKDNQNTFDNGFSTNDVVYVSESIAAASLGAKVSAATIGVVSADGELNNELGMSSGWGTPVGDTLDVVDTGHYITQTFTAGALQFKTVDTELASTSGTKSPDAKVLATAGGQDALVALESGGISTKGGTVTSRRVLLPVGDSNVSWGYLTNNGQLVVQRSLVWAMKADGVSSGKLLLVVGNATTPSTSELARKALIESWGYAVTLIDDGDSQANFDTAAPANDVVYITGSGSSVAVGTRLTAATIGVVSEDIGLVDELGIAEPAFVKRSSQNIDIFDNTHYVTSGFGLGSLQLYSYAPQLWTLSGMLAPGLQFLAGTHSLGSSFPPGLAILETGAELYGGGFAAGRRVQVPWSEGSFDITALTDDGRTVMKRAIEWGAGAGVNAMLPIAHWKLDDGVGPTAVDSIGGHDGTLVSTPPWVTGIIGGALDFDGTNDYVDVGTFDVSGSGLTTMGWFNADSLPATTDPRIVSKASSTAEADAWWQLSILTSASNANIRLRTKAGGTTSTLIDSSTNLNPGQWYFAVGTYNAATGQMKLYLDGTEVASQLHPAGGAIDTNPTVPVAIGANGTAEQFFDGVLDDVRVYNRALNATEIADLYAEGVGPALVAHWKLDDGVGPTAVDSIGGHDGTLVSTPPWVTGIIGGALDFDGTNDYVDVGTFDVSGSGLTTMGWFNADSLPATTDPRIVSKASSTAEADAWWQLSILTSASNANIRLRTKAGGTTSTLIDSSTNLNPGQWYFAVGTYNAATGQMKLYLDGTEVASQLHPAGGAIDTNPTVPVAIGANGTAEQFFDGVLDDVRVYNRALNATEIADLFTAGGGVGGGGGGPTIFEVRVATGNDDAEQRVSSGSVNLTSSDLELIADGSNDQLVGMRFTNVTVPNGATISSAYTQFQVDETNSGATNINIQGQAIDDAPTFTSGNSNISSRSRTSASVAWAPVAWTTVGEAGPDQRTPDIKAVMQEIVNRPGWASGNDMVIIITGSGERTAEAYNGSSSGAALLHIEY